MSKLKISTIDCLGYSVFNGDLNQLFPMQKTLISTINLYAYCIAEKDDLFKKSLQDSEILLPDGIGIVIASKLLLNKKIKKIAGDDLHHFLLETLNKKDSSSCFYLGSTNNTLKKIKQRVANDFPNIKVGTYSPPYREAFSDEDNKSMLNAINDFEPDVLFVGMTAPKQEKWSYLQKNNINSKLICPIGAVFDFYAGTVNRPGKIWINLGLEWLGRLIREPKRMWKRYLYYGFIFGYYLFKEKSKIFFSKKNQIL